jgi:NADH-quinone oxidoreductase subunit L
LLGSTQIEAFLRAVQSGVFSVTTLNLLALLFLSGSIGKSAQLPLTAWLPAAMVGPAPVSALIHSATMVAAGVYLILRLFPLFAAAPVAMAALLLVGGLTSLLASLAATVQTDLKRVLAWSTASQLGEMMLALGLAGPFAAAFRLVTHAAFKAALFLSAGAVDRAAGTRDLWRLGRLAWKMPLTALAFGLAAVSLAGIPPFSGFWSEDAILGRAAAAGWSLVIFILMLVFLAGIYISRAAVATFAAWPGAPGPEAHDPGWKMKAGMSALALASVLLGWILQDQRAAWLSFPRSAEPGLLWRLSTIAAGMAGLAFGAWRVRQHGPKPALGHLPQLLEKGLEAATYAPARLVLAISRSIGTLERRLDGVAQALVGLNIKVALQTIRFEDGFDRLEFGIGQTALRLAAETEATEERGFSNSLERFAALFSQGGQWLRRLQTGKIYLYILGMITWILMVGLLVILYWIALS